MGQSDHLQQNGLSTSTIIGNFQRYQLGYFKYLCMNLQQPMLSYLQQQQERQQFWYINNQKLDIMERQHQDLRRHICIHIKIHQQHIEYLSSQV